MKTHESTVDQFDAEALKELRPEQQLGKTALVLAAVCVAAWFSNIVNGSPLLDALPGMLILYVMVIIGLVVGRLCPFYLPSVAWVSLISIIATLPIFPGNGWIIGQLAGVLLGGGHPGTGVCRMAATVNSRCSSRPAGSWSLWPFSSSPAPLLGRRWWLT